MMFAVIVASAYEKPVNTADDLLQSGKFSFATVEHSLSHLQTQQRQSMLMSPCLSLILFVSSDLHSSSIP